MAAGRLDAADIAQLDSALDGLITTIPEQLTQYYMRQSGIDCKDEALVKVMSLAAQRFIESLLRDAVKIHKRQRPVRAQDKGKESAQNMPFLTSEDLAAALEEYGINLGHQAYYANGPPEQTAGR